MERICSKCEKEIKDNSKHCSSCGGKIVDKEHHRVKSVKRRKIMLRIVLPLIIILIIFTGVIFLLPIPYTATEAYDVQEPYTSYEAYYVTVPYTKTVKNPNCTFGILCDLYIDQTYYTEEERTRSVTKYRTVQKERQVQKKTTLFQIWTGQVGYWYKI